MNYFEEQAVKRARQAWRIEEKAEKAITQEYELLLDKVNHEVADLFANYSTEGEVNYNQLRMSLNQQELALYKRKIQDIISQNRDISDEEIQVELNKLLEYSNLTVLDSKVNTVEAHTLVTIHKSIEHISQSLLKTHDYVESYINYDIQRKTGEGKQVKKKDRSTLMNTLIASSALYGLTYAEAVKGSRHRLVRDLKRSVDSGVKRKESFPRLSKQLKREVMGGKGGKSTLSTLRGETTRVISETAMETYKEAGLEKYQFVATLDDRTSDTCQSMDGTIHKLVDAEVGVNYPPLHFNCRSTIAPYLDADDLAERQRRARNPETRQNYKVPGNMSYKEWDKKYNQ